METPISSLPPGVVSPAPGAFDLPRYDLRGEAERWIDENPEAYALFVRFARERVTKGRRFGVKAIAERVRWEWDLEWDGEFKLNNNLTAYIARRLAADVPGVGALIETRKVRC